MMELWVKKPLIFPKTKALKIEILFMLTCEQAYQSLPDELDDDFFDYAVATRLHPTTTEAW